MASFPTVQVPELDDDGHISAGTLPFPPLPKSDDQGIVDPYYGGRFYWREVGQAGGARFVELMYPDSFGEGSAADVLYGKLLPGHEPTEGALALDLAYGTVDLQFSDGAYVGIAFTNSQGSYQLDNRGANFGQVFALPSVATLLSGRAVTFSDGNNGTNVLANIGNAIRNLTPKVDVSTVHGTNHRGVSFDPALASVAKTLVSGTLYTQSIVVADAGPLTGILFQVTTAATATTLAKVAVFDYFTGALLAVSADFSSQMQSTGQKSISFAAPSAPIYNGQLVTMGLIWIGTGTPAIAGAPVSLAGNLGTNPGTTQVRSGTKTGLSDTPSPNPSPSLSNQAVLMMLR